MTEEISIHRDFPIGSRWSAPVQFHPLYGYEKNGEPAVTGDSIVIRVTAHTVGAALRRNQDAGVMFAVEDDTRQFFEINDGIALDTLERCK